MVNTVDAMKHTSKQLDNCVIKKFGQQFKIAIIYNPIKRLHINKH